MLPHVCPTHIGFSTDYFEFQCNMMLMDCETCGFHSHYFHTNFILGISWVGSDKELILFVFLIIAI